eukprot:m.681277 g.681277  ORF g.681277 m.681277 type:complete len:652 (-) comp22811_c2_seq15:341-2296(-)
MVRTTRPPAGVDICRMGFMMMVAPFTLAILIQSVAGYIFDQSDAIDARILNIQMRDTEMFGSGSFRRDIFIKELPEQGVPDPISGCRVHLVIANINAAKGDSLASVKINGVQGLDLNTSSDADLTYLDWLRAHMDSRNNDLWISFHTRNTQWIDRGATNVTFLVDVQMQSGATPVVAFKVNAGAAPSTSADLTHVAFREQGSVAVMHFHCRSNQACTLQAIRFSGDTVNVSVTSIPPEGHVVITHPLTRAVAVGDVWTAVVNGRDGFGGRVIVQRFSIEAWPSSSDCPFFGVNDTTAKTLQQVSIDSVFYDGANFQGKCDRNLSTIVDQLNGSFHVFTDTATAAQVSLAGRSSSIDALLLGDEVDGDVDASHLRGSYSRAMAAMRAVPDVATYQGSKTNRNVGAFAGICDIQGSDAYMAACAPTMLAVDHKLPLLYPYQYLRNARDNTVPLPFWGYAQLYSHAWSYQAHAEEIAHQIGQTVMSGSKSLMLFQSEQNLFDAAGKDELAVVAGTLKTVRALGELLRIGDIGGMGWTLGDTVHDVAVEVIRSPEQMVVVVMNTDASGYSNLLCHIDVDRHWDFHSNTVDTLSLQLASAPDVSSVGNWTEVVDGSTVPLRDATVTSANGVVTVHNIKLSTVPFASVRYFVASVSS